VFALLKRHSLIKALDQYISKVLVQFFYKILFYKILFCEILFYSIRLMTVCLLKAIALQLCFYWAPKIIPKYRERVYKYNHTFVSEFYHYSFLCFHAFLNQTHNKHSDFDSTDHLLDIRECDNFLKEQVFIT